MIHKVIISLASNHDQEQNLYQARQCLAQVFSSCQYTEAIWTEPVGGKSSDSSNLQTLPANYLNQLVTATTTLIVEALQTALKDIECRMGRTAEDRQKGIVRIDLDLLLYDDQRYHLRDWQRPYIKTLLNIIANQK